MYNDDDVLIKHSGLPSGGTLHICGYEYPAVAGSRGTVLSIMQFGSLERATSSSAAPVALSYKRKICRSHVMYYLSFESLTASGESFICTVLE